MPTRPALLLRAVGVGVVRSITRSAARLDHDRIDACRAIRAPPSADDRLIDVVTEATARAVRHGWGFTLVLVRGEPGSPTRSARALRAADSLVTVSGGELALLLPETAGDRVPFVLARLAEAGGAPPFSYGLACCPADGRDPAVLCRTAAERLEAACSAATEPERIRTRDGGDGIPVHQETAAVRSPVVDEQCQSGLVPGKSFTGRATMMRRAADRLRSLLRGELDDSARSSRRRGRPRSTSCAAKSSPSAT